MKDALSPTLWGSHQGLPQAPHQGTDLQPRRLAAARRIPGLQAALRHAAGLVRHALAIELAQLGPPYRAVVVGRQVHGGDDLVRLQVAQPAQEAHDLERLERGAREGGRRAAMGAHGRSSGRQPLSSASSSWRTGAERGAPAAIR